VVACMGQVICVHSLPDDIADYIIRSLTVRVFLAGIALVPMALISRSVLAVIFRLPQEFRSDIARANSSDPVRNSGNSWLDLMVGRGAGSSVRAGRLCLGDQQPDIVWLSARNFSWPVCSYAIDVGWGVDGIKSGSIYTG
jgi:hypothetical protein